MAEFAEILAQVETSQLMWAPLRVAPGFKLELAAAADTPAHDSGLTSASRLGAASAYFQPMDATPYSVAKREHAESRIEDAAAEVVRIDEFAARFPRLLETARRAPQHLRALRREMAWRLHPDRAGADARAASERMAQFNAMIDAALAQLNAKRSRARSD